MNKIEDKFKIVANGVTLSDEVRSEMRARLVEYMEYKPIRVETGVQVKKNHARTTIFSYFHSHHFSGALMIALLVTGSTFGVSFAADDALPGDLLYPVKVNVNEGIKTVLTTTAEDRIAWEQERAERRLVEASQLVAEGRFDDENKETVSRLFAEHTEAMVEQVLAAEEADPVFVAEVSSVFEDTLETHEAVLARIIVEQDGNNDEAGLDLVEQVRTASMEVEKIRNDAEEKIAVDISGTESEGRVIVGSSSPDTKTESANLRVRAAYRAQERALALLSKVKELQAGIEDEMLKQQVQAQVAYGEEYMNRGAKALEENRMGDAYAGYKKAAASFQKIDQLLSVANLFSVEILPDDTVEQKDESVPEEDSTQVDEDLNALRTHVQEQIQEARSVLLTQGGHATDEVGEINDAIKDASAQALRAEIAMALGDTVRAHRLFDRALMIITDVHKTLKEGVDANGVKEIPVQYDEEVKSAGVGVYHQYRDGVHTYTGEITVPNPCALVQTEAFVMESFPEQVGLSITTSNPEGGVMCAQVLSKKQFTVEVQASESAVFNGIKVNGVAQQWEYHEGMFVPQTVHQGGNSVILNSVIDAVE